MGHAGRDVHPPVVVLADLEDQGRLVGLRAGPQVVEHDHRPSEGDVPVVGLVAVVVEADEGPLLAVGPVGLDHLRRPPYPLLPERLDEAAPVVAMDIRGDHDHAQDGVGLLDQRHGAQASQPADPPPPARPAQATLQPTRRRPTSVIATRRAAPTTVAGPEAPAVEPVPSTARATRKPLRATVAADTGRAPAEGGPKHGQGAGWLPA